MFSAGNIFLTNKWTPAQIPTAAWYDAADASTITHSSGSVSQWNDKSGNGRHVSQGTGSAQPTTNARAINGLNALNFDGGDRLLRTTSPSAIFPVGSKTTAMHVCLLDVAAAQNIITYFMRATSLTSGSNYNGAGGNFLECHWDATEGVEVRMIAEDEPFTTTGVIASDTTNPPVAGTAFMFGGEVDRSGAKLASTAGKDGTLTYATSPAPTNNAADIAAGAFVIGGHGSTDSALNRLLDGAIGEIVIAHNITAATRQRIEGYLAWKWGLQGSLPSAHPYRWSAP